MKFKKGDRVVVKDASYSRCFVDGMDMGYIAPVDMDEEWIVLSDAAFNHVETACKETDMGYRYNHNTTVIQRRLMVAFTHRDFLKHATCPTCNKSWRAY